LQIARIKATEKKVELSNLLLHEASEEEKSQIRGLESQMQRGLPEAFTDQLKKLMETSSIDD
jgi:hypothetical protein